MLAAELLIIFLCLFCGGLLKGATGAGAPVLAVPALVMFFDVKTAVIILLLPNLFTNSWQAWTYRSHLPRERFLTLLILGGIVGIAAGTWALTRLPSDILQVVVGGVVMLYIGFRLAHPHWLLGRTLGTAMSAPAGLVAGILQGASGISAPVSITFLNAMRLERVAFIPTISLLFLVFVMIQIPALGFGGLLTPELMLISALAAVPVWLAMPLGSRLARTISPQIFDRITLVLLAILSLKLVVDGLIALC